MDKLRTKIREVYGTEGKFAEAIGLTKSGLSMKLRGERGWSFKQIMTAQRLLDIPYDQVEAYFGGGA